VSIVKGGRFTHAARVSENPTDLAAQRQRREGAIRTTFIASVAVRVLSAFCSLAQVPLALAFLGTEAFGFWITLTSTTLLLSAADLGLGLAMQNQVAEALGRNQTNRTPALFLTTFLGLAVIGGAMLALGIPLARLIDWGDLFHLTRPELVTGAARGAIAALVLFSIGLPLAAATRLANACQWGWLAAIWNAAGVAGQLLVIACAGRIGTSFAGFVLLAGAPPLLANVGLLLHTARRLRWRWADLGFATPQERRVLLHSSWDFCLPQVGAAFIYNAAAPIISAVAGAPAVTAYNVVQRLFGLFGQLQQMVLTPLWPAYTEALARADADWILASYRRSLRGTLLGICLPLVFAAAILPWIIALWTGAGAVSLPDGLVWLLCAWNSLLAISNAPAYLLGGLGRMRRLGLISFGGSVFTAVGMLAFGSQWGANGVIAGLVTGYLVIMLPGTFYETAAALRALRKNRTPVRAAGRRLLPDSVRRPVLRLLSGPPRGRHNRRFSAGIFKVDRLGDFVIALGAIRRMTEHFGPDRCLLVVSTVAEPLAALEFPQTPRIVLPVTAGGIVRELVPTAWRHRRRFADVNCETVLCLRHQRESYHDVVLSWLTADRLVKLAPQEYPAIDPEHASSAELEAHRRVVTSTLGRQFSLAEVLPKFTAFAPSAGGGLLVCPFSIDPLRDIPQATLLSALNEWSRAHAEDIRFSGSTADLPRLEALCREARALGITAAGLAEPTDAVGFIQQVAGAKIVLTADSAGAHIATAFDKPTVVVQGGGHAGVFGPWRRSSCQIWLQHRLPCYGCVDHCTETENFCLTRIPSGQIVAALTAVSP